MIVSNPSVAYDIPLFILEILLILLARYELMSSMITEEFLACFCQIPPPSNVSWDSARLSNCKDSQSHQFAGFLGGCLLRIPSQEIPTDTSHEPDPLDA
jgi:hypothetical protein